MSPQRNDTAAMPDIIYSHHIFAQLAQAFPHTAARCVPLVLYHDIINEEAQRHIYYHADFCSLYIVRRGRGTHIIDGAGYGVARGDVYAMGVGMKHRFTDCHDLVTDTLHFSPTLFDSATLSALTETPGFQSLFVLPPAERGIEENGGRWLHLTPSAYTQVAEMVAELHTEWSSGSASGVLLTAGLFLRLLVRLARFHAESNRGEYIEVATPIEGHEATVATAIRYMDAHFAEPLRIEQVAAKVYLSPDHFAEVFARAMGRTPRDYLRHLRVERAKLLLTTTNASIAQIAQESGFGESAYLTRVLRTATGKTPRELRRESRP